MAAWGHDVDTILLMVVTVINLIWVIYDVRYHRKYVRPRKAFTDACLATWDAITSGKGYAPEVKPLWDRAHRAYCKLTGSVPMKDFMKSIDVRIQEANEPSFLKREREYRKAVDVVLDWHRKGGPMLVLLALLGMGCGQSKSPFAPPRHYPTAQKKKNRGGAIYSLAAETLTGKPVGHALGERARSARTKWARRTGGTPVALAADRRA